MTLSARIKKIRVSFIEFINHKDTTPETNKPFATE